MVWDAFVLVCGLITSIFMLWQGFFLIERYQEQLNSRENIGLIRMLALSFKDQFKNKAIKLEILANEKFSSVTIRYF